VLQKNVRGLDVAVDDALLVYDRERFRYAPDQCHGHPRRQAVLLRDAFGERMALQELGREEARSLGGHTVSDVAHDARVPELREQGGLAREANEVQPRVVEHLEGDRQPGFAVAGPVDRAHRTGVEPALDFEAVGHDEAWL
jgi:hypothetical protein